MKTVFKKFPERKETSLNALSFLRYGLSEKRSHIPFIELNGSFGRINNIFLPHKRGYNSAVIHEYKICNKYFGEQVKQQNLEFGQWQILYKNYCKFILENKEKIIGIKQVIMRTILFCENGEITGSTQSIIQLKNVKKLCLFFEYNPLKKIINTAPLKDRIH